MDRLKGKVALVTGASTGIGKAIAIRFGQEGAAICAVADKNIQGAQDTTKEIEAAGGRAIAVQADVSKLADIDRMIGETVSKFGRLDILVNNAAVYIGGLIPEVTEEDWDITIDVNLKSVFFCSQKALPHMLEQGKGKIINIASNWGQVGYVGAAAYCTSKGGMINLTRQMGLELAPQKINVNAIGPATTRTPINEAFFSDPEKSTTLLSKLPMGRMAEPEEIASAALYLASDEADFVTGHTLFIDGGYLSQ